jgi:hypothetical protein
VSNAAGELDYLRSAAHRSFERPYGIAWFLMLGAELTRHTSAEGRRWFNVLSPLATECATRLCGYIEATDYPVRAGFHNNSAFALALGLEYADICCDAAMAELLRHKCRSWFGNDADCPAWEPDGEDFLSPALTEVLCMSRALAPAEFSTWFARSLCNRPTSICARASPMSQTITLEVIGWRRSRCWRSTPETRPQRGS